MLASARRWLLGVSMAIVACLALPSACSVPDYEFVDVPELVNSARTACRRDADCSELPLTRRCDGAAGFCVECLPNSEPDATLCGAGLFCRDDGRCVIGCNDDTDCNDGLSCDTASGRCTGCSEAGDCLVGTACEASVCVPACTDSDACPAGFSCCSGVCANVLSDPQHCQGCGLACPEADECVNGVCGTTGCPAGFEDCDGERQNGCESKLASDRENCGACGNDCSPGFCNGGRCSSLDCPDGRADCDSDTDNECESDLESTDTCGLCSQRCASINGTAACAQELCTIVCAAGHRDCDRDAETGCETDVDSDVENCGGCSLTCTNENGTTRCLAGACAPECATGFDDCDGDPRNGCETRTETSLDDCGACGASCELDNANAVCELGACSIVACEPGFDDCDGDPDTGCEADLSSPETCGDCDTRCDENGGRASCDGRECRIECDPERDDCSGGLVDGCETNLLVSVRHCGSCGEACEAPPGSTPACDQGTCTVSDCPSPFADCSDESSPGDTTCETNTNTDLNHCGGCGIECYFPNGTGRCNAGTCVLQGCEPGFEHCDTNLMNGCETRLGTQQDCAACDDVCQTADVNVRSNVCTGSAPNWSCVASCTPGWDSCDGDASDGCETNITSPANCGECNRVCNLANTNLHECVAGACGVSTCDAGFANCNAGQPGGALDGCERPVSSDVMNCGDCGRVCSSNRGTPSCSNGSCRIDCATGFGNCDNDVSDGCEHDTSEDPANCGTCRNVCGASTPFCVAGSCRPRLDIVVAGSSSGNVAGTGQNLRLVHALRSAPGSHRALIVGVAGRGNNPGARPVQVSFDSLPMTLAIEAAPGPVHAAIYYLTENQLPVPGSYELLVTATPQSTFGFVANVLELTGVESGARAIEATLAAQSESCTPVNNVINVSSVGAVVYGILAIDGTAAPANLQASGQTPTLSQLTISGPLGVAAGRLPPATRTGAFNFNWTQPSGCNRWRHALVAVRPAVTP